MRRQIIPLACLLLLWTFTAYVKCQAATLTPQIKVEEQPEGIKLTCPDGYNFTKDGESGNSLTLVYEDEFTGEYICKKGDAEELIYVKFRTCDNCIELDPTAAVGIAVGDLVATILIGVAVYLIFSQPRTAVTSVTSHKKRSDRQHLIPGGGNSNDVYQGLKGRPTDAYDVLNHRR
ncbi:T-cell surface glycoprotein CD3 gamma chain isoform 1-T2 [Polymixia lowei]